MSENLTHPRDKSCQTCRLPLSCIKLENALFMWTGVPLSFQVAEEIHLRLPSTSEAVQTDSILAHSPVCLRAYLSRVDLLRLTRPQTLNFHLISPVNQIQSFRDDQSINPGGGSGIVAAELQSQSNYRTQRVSRPSKRNPSAHPEVS